MRVLGALLGCAIASFAIANLLGLPGLFWIFFCIGAIVCVPLACIQASFDSAEDRRERRADERQEWLAEEMKIAMALTAERRRAAQQTINIDARSVHYHNETKATKAIVHKP